MLTIPEIASSFGTIVSSDLREIASSFGAVANETSSQN